MNKVALFTTGKNLFESTLFLVSVFDLEPSGVLVHAYNQSDSREYTLAISEREFAKAGYNRTFASIKSLVDTVELKPFGTSLMLMSNDELISKPKVPLNAVEAREEIFKCNEVIITGLVELCKVKPSGLDAVQWLGEWLLNHNPNKPMVEE